MRHIILGTAGHIDHGKSSLVKALTGIDPDRLKEEKERGITIDLGFADLQYPDGLAIGIVDVPGHERLIKNMLAGAGGIDMVLFVIAADEGIMPQSREHLHICNLLRIKSGLIAVTKSDIVEADWLSLVMEETKGFVKGTFLEGADIVPVSSVTGHNLDVLKEKIREVALEVSPKPDGGLFRLPVDRVFTIKGFGTVVTGTAVSGSISVDEQAEILPSGINTRIRGLQSHGKASKAVRAGQRAALNLQGVEKNDLKRGDAVVAPGRFHPTDMLDARIEALSIIKSRSPVHFHLGTSETVARIILYGKDKLAPGEGCYCQFRLNEKIVAQSSDRFIIRRFSPLDTIGGGEVLDSSPSKRKRTEGLDDLAVYESGHLKDKIAVKVKKASFKGIPRNFLEGWINAEVSSIGAAVVSLAKEGIIREFDGTLFHKDILSSFKDSVITTLRDFHSKNPLRQGMQREELKALFNMEPRLFGGLLASLPELDMDKEIVKLKGFRASLPGEEKQKVLDILEKSGFQPPSKGELAVMLSLDEKKTGDILRLMQNEGAVMRMNDSTYLSMNTYNRMLELLRAFFKGKPEMTVSEFRDVLGTSRKYALPFLEYLDSRKITLRVGDIRKSLLK